MFENPEALARGAAELFVSAAAAAIQASGRFVVALSGGTTPQALYALLGNEPYSSRMQWQFVQWFWGDERCVPPNDPASNYRMVRDALLDRVPVPETNVHRIQGEDDPAVAAAAYEQTLRATFAAPAPAGHRFDLVLLGIGVDGHTASLFPGGSAVRERRRWVMAEYVEAVAMWRVTLTPVVINAAVDVVFLVTGPEKAPILRRVLEGPYEPDVLPAQAIGRSGTGPRWMVDAAAAKEVPTR